MNGNLEMEVVRRVVFKNMLIATDLSAASASALSHAVAVARHYKATLYLLHVTSWEAYYASPAGAPTVLDRTAKVEEHFRELIAAAGLDHLPHQVLLKWGNIVDVVLGVVREEQIDLMVLGTHGRRGLSKLFRGSIAEGLIRQATCPVMTLGPTTLGVLPKAEFARILYATDFSIESVRALRYAMSLSQEFQASLTLVHVGRMPIRGDERTIREQLTNRLRLMLPSEARLWVRELRWEVRLEPTVAGGIVRAAKENNIDLIVMGARAAGTSVRASAHVGSTVDGVAAQAPCPVLTVQGSVNAVRQPQAA
jgi:nucleotide-binding universal stress UspA family protein